jgi:hypothetical protein
MRYERKQKFRVNFKVSGAQASEKGAQIGVKVFRGLTSG